MSEWVEGTLSDVIAALDAGVSVNAEDRPHGAGEIGVLKTSAVSGGRFYPGQNKTVVQNERRLVAEPVQADSILVSRMNTPALVGESCYVEEAHPTLFLPDRVWQLKPKDRSKLNMRWLSFILQSAEYRRYVEVHATGTSGSMKNLPKSKLLALPINSPERCEQAKIAGVLDTLDIAIHETEAIVAKLKAIKQGLLHDLLTRGIDDNGELRPPQPEAPHLYKPSPLGWIPQQWDPKSIGQLLAEPTRNGLYKPSQFHGCGPLMVQMGGLFASEIADFHTARRVSVSPFEFNTFGLSIGDLLFARRSLVFDGAGQCVIVRDLPEPATFESSIVRVRIRGDVADPEFVCLFLRSERSYAQRRTLIRQVAVSGVSSSDIRQFLVALPSTHEQELILERQSEAQAQIDCESQALAKLRNQKAGLMDDLLTGRVRVTPLLSQAQRQEAERFADGMGA